MYIKSASEVLFTNKIRETAQSNWFKVAVGVTAVAGAALIIVGFLPYFSSLQSIGFNASLMAGGILVMVAGGGCIAIKILKPETLKEIASIGKSHENAKATFKEYMQDCLRADVFFPQPPKLDKVLTDIEIQEQLKTTPLNSKVFSLVTTTGVQNDIPRSSHDSEHLHVYQVASQYNGTEHHDGTTIYPAGKVMSCSVNDKTHGPLARRTNPTAFELGNATLGHLGFNMLEHVLPTAGKTYDIDSSIAHGYLKPTSENLEKLTSEFKENYAKTEYVCYENKPKGGGENSVYIFLQSAPAVGYTNTDIIQNSDELQKYAALANSLAFFQFGINMAKQTGKEVVLHHTAVGGSAYANKEENLQWGFVQAALALQKEMEEAGVKVQMEEYKGPKGDSPISGPMQNIAQNLDIPARPRIGEDARQ